MAEGVDPGGGGAPPRVADKAPTAFRTISEVAEELDLPQHVLRFWETRFSQIRPLKRGGGRRYYRPDDVELLRGIRHLLYGQGYTIKGVQQILRERGPRHVQAIEPAEGGPAAPPPGDAAGEAEGEAPDAVEAAGPAPGLAPADLAALRDALAELEECRRVLAALGWDGGEAA